MMFIFGMSGDTIDTNIKYQISNIPPSLKLRRASGEEKDLMAVRLELIKAAQIIFKNIFQLLGISMPKKM